MSGLLKVLLLLNLMCSVCYASFQTEDMDITGDLTLGGNLSLSTNLSSTVTLDENVTTSIVINIGSETWYLKAYKN